LIVTRNNTIIPNVCITLVPVHIFANFTHHGQSESVLKYASAQYVGSKGYGIEAV